MQGMILFHDLQLQGLPGYEAARDSMPGDGQLPLGTAALPAPPTR